MSALTAGADVDKILAGRVGDRTVADAINETIAKVGENMTLRRAAAVVGRQRRGRKLRAQFGHRRAWQDRRDRRAGIRPATPDELKAFGRMVAMHVASANPQAIEPSGLDAGGCRARKNVLAEKFKAQGKPQTSSRRLSSPGSRPSTKKSACSISALSSTIKKSVAQAVKESEGKVGAPIKITGLRALCARRGHRSAKRRFRRRSCRACRRALIGCSA